MKNITKLALVASVASLFSTAVVAPAFAGEAPASTEVKCQGINACKGHSKCHTAQNACAGQNACKGKGWLPAPNAEECAKQGGTVVK